MILPTQSAEVNGRTDRHLPHLPPHNRDAERALLGAMLRDNGSIAEAVGLACAADFYTVAHSIIFRAVLDLHNIGKPADIVTIAECLSQAKLMDEIGGAVYLADLWDAAPSARNFRHYAEIIREQAKRRRLSCDWAVMFILGRTANTFARLSVHAGPGAAVQLPVSVDWSAWPAVVNDPVFSMPNRFAEWQHEFAANIQRIPESLHLFAPKVDAIVNAASPWEPFADAWDWNDLDIQNWEDYERHEHHFDF